MYMYITSEIKLNTILDVKCDRYITLYVNQLMMAAGDEWCRSESVIVYVWQ